MRVETLERSLSTGVTNGVHLHTDVTDWPAEEGAIDTCKVETWKDTAGRYRDARPPVADQTEARQVATH